MIQGASSLSNIKQCDSYTSLQYTRPYEPRREKKNGLQDFRPGPTPSLSVQTQKHTTGH